MNISVREVKLPVFGFAPKKQKQKTERAFSIERNGNKMSNSNKKNAALSSIKMQAANEVGVPLKDNGYNGDLTAKQVGSVGGQMVKIMTPERQWKFTRKNRNVMGHEVVVTYIVRVGV